MDYRAVIIEKAGPVATLRLRPLAVSFNLEPYAEIHEEVGRALSEIRLDDDIRVLVITGENNGQFLWSRSSGAGNKAWRPARLG